MNSKFSIYYCLAIFSSFYLVQVLADTNAVAILKGNQISGVVLFTQKDDLLTVRVNITGLPAGSAAKHGLHIHTFGIVDPSDNVTIRCGSTGSHFNLLGLTHGDINDLIRHGGDYGNVIADSFGRIITTFSDIQTKLSGAFSIIGRTVVLHQLEDDLGRGGNPDSLITGNAGARIACGVIGLSP